MPKNTYTKEEIEIINVKKLLTIREAAVILGRHQRSVSRLIAQGRLRVCRFSKRTIRIPRKIIDAFIEKHTTGCG